MSLIGPLAQFLRRKYVNRFETASAFPREAQRDKLMEILQANGGTAYGKAYGFDQIGSVADYQARVPIVRADALRPWLDRMLAGEKNILTYQDPLYYGMTTGTTGPPKFTPITAAYRDEYQTVVQTFVSGIYRDHPQAFEGKVLYFIGSADQARSPMGVHCGTMSGFNFVNLPPLLKKMYAVPYEIMVAGHSWSRNYVTALLSLPQKISMMLGITAAPMIGLLQFIDEHLERLIQDLETGTLHPDLILTPEERAIVAKMHKARPEAAAQLRRCLQQGTRDAKSLWPGLELMVCWKSSHAGTLIPQLRKLTHDRLPVRDAIYSATEGWCNVPMSDTELGGPLALQAHFYEFVPEDAEGDAPILLAHELEAGKRYRILFTTSGGMYRYDIGDVLEITGFYQKNPIAHFVRKTSQMCNLVGEKLTDYHVTEAVLKAAAAHGLTLPFFVASPDTKAFPPGYRIQAELPADIAPEAVKQLAAELETQLQAANYDYQATRAEGQLAPVQLESLPSGSGTRFREARIRAGGDEAQLKPLVLISDPAKLEQLLG